MKLKIEMSKNEATVVSKFLKEVSGESFENTHDKGKWGRVDSTDTEIEFNLEPEFLTEALDLFRSTFKVGKVMVELLFEKMEHFNKKWTDVADVPPTEEFPLEYVKDVSDEQVQATLEQIRKQPIVDFKPIHVTDEQFMAAHGFAKTTEEEDFRKEVSESM